MAGETTQMFIKMIDEHGKKIDKLEQKVDNKIDKLENKVDELIALKNKVIAAGVILSAIFGFLWDWFKHLFNRG